MEDLLKLLYLQPIEVPAHILHLHFKKRRVDHIRETVEVYIPIGGHRASATVFLTHDEDADLRELKHAIEIVHDSYLGKEARKVLRGDTD